MPFLVFSLAVLFAVDLANVDSPYRDWPRNLKFYLSSAEDCKDAKMDEMPQYDAKTLLDGRLVAFKKQEVCRLLRLKSEFESSPQKFCPEMKGSQTGECFSVISDQLQKAMGLDTTGVVLLQSIWVQFVLKTYKKADVDSLEKFSQLVAVFPKALSLLDTRKKPIDFVLPGKDLSTADVHSNQEEEEGTRQFAWKNLDEWKKLLEHIETKLSKEPTAKNRYEEIVRVHRSQLRKFAEKWKYPI